MKAEKMMKSERPSLRTVAAHVELSPTAVSLALRGDSSIPPETRERVQAAAEELNYEYVPRRKKSSPKRLNRLSFVMPDFGDRPLTANQFYGALLVEVEQACQSRYAGVHFVVLQRDHPENAELPPVLTHDLDGILLASPYPRALIERLDRESGCPIVLIDHVFPGSPYDSVMMNDFYSAYQATQHLIERGHAHILVMNGRCRNDDFPPSYKDRYRGYCEACADFGIKAYPAATVPDQIDERSGSDPNQCGPFQEWLGHALRRIPQVTALLGVGDYFALGALYVLPHLGFRVPEDFSVVGCDDFDMSSASTPPLTTIHPYKETIALIAVKRLLKRIAGDDSPPLHLHVGTDFVVRASTAPPRAS